MADRFLARALRGAAITAVSPVAVSALPRGWGPVELVHNAIDVASYAADVQRHRQRVAFLGRDDPRKGLDVVLEAWPYVLARHPSAELIVIGAQRPEPTPSVTFAGRVSEGEKRRLLSSASIYVAPNLSGESFGIVVAEAMAAGCAVIASDILAFRDVAPHARFAPPGDRRAWADAIVGLLDDESEVTRLSGESTTAVTRFDWSDAVDRYRRVYQRVLA
jgi:phosphatidylinositol alpha-mannosyltransferase